MNPKMRRLIVPLLLLVSLISPLPAQQAGLEMLTTRDGLSQGYIANIYQDNEGFIWFATKNGLNRYDGYHFEVFTHDPYNPHTLSDDRVQPITEQGEYLILGTWTAGVNFFHKKTRKVYRLPIDMILPGITDDFSTVIWAQADEAGNIWAEVNVVSKFRRLCKITVPPEFWVSPFPDEWQKRIKIETWPRHVSGEAEISLDKKWVYVPLSDTLFRVDVHNNRFTPLAQINGVGLNFINVDKRGNIWITWLVDNAVSGLYRLTPGASFTPTAVPMPPQFNNIRFFTKDRIWVSTYQHNYAFRLDEQGFFDASRPEFPGVFVPEGYCCAISDRSGLVWIGTNGLGIIKLNPRSLQFRHLFPGQSIYGTVVADRQGNICTFNNLNQVLLDPKPPRSPGLPFLPALNGLLDNAKILEDGSGNYWVAGIERKTWLFNLIKTDADGRLIRFAVPATTRFQGYLIAAFDERKHPWLSVDSRLIHFDPAVDSFEVFDFQQSLPEMNISTALAQSPDGAWWIGMEKGLVQATPNGHGFQVRAFKNDPSSLNSLRHNTVSCLMPDPADPAILWIGTKGGGLDRLDTRTLQFSHLTTAEGLPNNVIYGILSDEAGNLWMSSNKGLICYQPASGRIKNYTREDGVQDNEFNTSAFGKGPSGELLFGGVNGLTVFNPRAMLIDTLAPRTLITGLRINDNDLSWNDTTGVLSGAVEFARKIVVPYSRNNITLDFVAMNFASPAKNRFRYYLEGAEPEWVHESAEHTANYLNLSPGTYVFRVKSANSEGLWSEEVTELKIVVLPPWYRSWAAYLGYALLLGGGVFFFYRFQLNRKLEHAENERLKELDLVKNRLYTNITHEFRTPLTVILGMTEQMEGEIGNRKLEMDDPAERQVQFLISNFQSPLSLIRRNGQNLLRLINQVLDLSKLESGNMRLNLVQADWVAFVKYIAESFQSFAAVKNIRLQFHSETDSLNMAYDPEKIQAIVSNLLSNAIKFTPEGGEVGVNIRTLNDGPQPCCELRVRDTGIGIPADRLEQIFDRFYQVDSSATRAGEGSGIGLALVRELVKLMGGKISVESSPGAGSVFIVTLPVSDGGSTQTAPMTEFEPPAFATQPRKMPRPAPEDPDKSLVLLVEDNDDVRQYLRQCLAGEYQLIEAADGQTGIELALERVPDLVISDVMMPRKDGFELCQTLKTDERSSHIPIVLLTAKTDVASRIEGLTRGADDYIAKPFDRLELLARAHNLLDNRRRLQARYGRGFLSGEPVETPDEVAEVEDAFLLKLRGIVEAHLNDADFDMDRLSRAVGMSHSQIFRKLKALTGRSPSTFIRSVRLQQARHLLQNTTLSVSEIAYETGFSSPTYFSRMFLEEFGQTPTESR